MLESAQYVSFICSLAFLRNIKKYACFIGLNFSIIQKKQQENIKYFYYIWKILNMAFNVSAVNSIHFLCCFSGCNQRKTNHQYVRYGNLNLSSIYTFCTLHSYINIIIPMWTFSLFFPIFCIIQRCSIFDVLPLSYWDIYRIKECKKKKGKKEEEYFIVFCRKMLAGVGLSDWLLLFLSHFLCHPAGYQKYHPQAKLPTLTTRKDELLHTEKESQGPLGALNHSLRHWGGGWK